MSFKAVVECLLGNLSDHSRQLIRSIFLLNILVFAIIISGAIAFCYNTTSISAEQSTPQKENASSQSSKIQMQTIRVGYFPFDGFHMYDKRGSRYGYGYDFLQKIRDYTNWKFEYSDPKHEWPEMLQLLQDKKIDILPGVSKTPERMSKFEFSKKPICQVATILTVKAGNMRYRTDNFSNWNGIRIGMLKNSTQNDKLHNYSKENGFTYEKVEFTSIFELIDALHNTNKIDAALTSTLRNITESEWVCAKFHESEMYIAVRKNDKDLLKELDRAMEQIDQNLPDFRNQLYRTYYSQKKSGIIPFSQQEFAYLDEIKKSGRQFTAILNPDRKPFSWIENGEYRGIFKDYADEISKRTGISFRFVPVATRKEYYAMYNSPNIDIVLDMPLNLQDAEEKNLKLTQSYFSASVSMLRDKSAENTIKTVSILKNSALSKKILNIIPNTIKIRYCNSIPELITDVKSNQSDATYLYTRCAEHAVYEDIHNQFVSVYVPILENGFAIGVRETHNPILLAILNRTVLSFDDSFANQVRARHTAEFKEVFSFAIFIHKYPYLALGVPFGSLILICLILTVLLTVHNRHRRELEISMTKWTAASKFAGLHPFQMNIATREIINDTKLISSFWPIIDNKAVPPRDWVCPEDLPDIEKAHDDINAGISDHLSITYRVIQNGKTRHFLCHAVRDTKNPTIMVGIIYETTVLKNIEAQRDAVQKLWETVADNAPIMMFVKSEKDDFRYIQCNRNFAAFLGRKPEEVIGHTDAELFNRPLDVEMFHDWDKIIMSGKTPQTFSESAESFDGKLHYIQTVKMPFWEPDGRALLIGIATDVTELQKSRDEARQHEEFFRLTLQSIGDGVLTTDAQGIVQILNPVAEQLIGMTAEQAKDKPHEEIFRIVNTLDDTPLESPLKRALDSGQIAEIGNHTDLLSFNGNRFHIADCAGPIYNRNNKIIGAVLIFRDITKEYKQHEELQASIALWNLTSDITKLSPFRMHIPTRKVYGDLERLNRFWPVVDGKAILPDQWVYSEDLAEGDKSYSDFLNGTSDTFYVTYRVIIDGKFQYFRRYGKHDLSNPEMMVGIVQNITLDKEIEHQRNASQHLWDKVVAAMPMLHFVKSADDDFRYIECNELFAKFVGKSREDIIGHTDWEIFKRAEDADEFHNKDLSIMESGQASDFYESAQGSDKFYHFQTVKMPFIDANGQHLLIGLSVDISAYKKVEKERNAAENLWNETFSAMPIILYVKAAWNNFRYVQCNDNFCHLFGKSQKDIIGRNDFEIFPHSDEVAAFHSTDTKAMNAGIPLETDETLSGADNKIYHFRSVKMPAKDIYGRPILVGMAVNITEMVEQRKQMQATTFQLEAGCLMTRTFTFELNTNQEIIAANGMFEDLWPHVDGKPLPINDWILHEDYEETSTAIKYFFSKGFPEVTINFRTDWFGKRRYYKSIFKKQGERIYGVTSDITELVEASEENRANVSMWNFVMDELPVRFFVKNADDNCKYLMCNKANADFLGLLKEQVIGKTTEEICSPSPEIATYLEEEQQILRDRKVAHSRISIPDPNGMIQEMEKIEMPVVGAGNKNLLVSIAFDITEREQSLRLAEISARILAGIVAEQDFSKVLKMIGRSTIDILKCSQTVFGKCNEKGELHFLLDVSDDPNLLISGNPQISDDRVGEYEKIWNQYLDQFEKDEIVCYSRLGDVPQLESFCDKHSLYRESGVAAVPVKADGYLKEIMLVIFKESRPFTELDKQTLRAIANCIRMAEYRYNQDKALIRAQEEQAHQLAETTATNESLSVFMNSEYSNIPYEQILEIIRSHLGASHCYVQRFDFINLQEICHAETSIPGRKKILDEHASIPFELSEIRFQELVNNGIFYRQNLSDKKVLERLGPRWQDIISRNGFKAIWIGEVNINKTLWGQIAILYDNESKKVFDLRDESFVRSAAQLISLILMREMSRNNLIHSLETQENTTECLRCIAEGNEASIAIRQILNIIKKQTNANLAFMTELNEDNFTAKTWHNLQNIFEDNEKSKIFFNSDEEWFRLFKQNKPLFIQNTTQSDATHLLGSRDFLLQGESSVLSFYEIPIHCDKKLWGSVGIMFTDSVTKLEKSNLDFMTNAINFFEILLNRQENTRKLNEAVKLAQAAEKAKSFFLASMSHEIRTPLNAVIGYSEMLHDTLFVDQVQKEYVENISIAGTSLLQLINDILDLSKLEAGQMPILPERVDFPKYAHDVCRTFQYSANKKKQKLIIDVPENMPPIMLDQMRMRQIFFNLVGNSVKFTPENGTIRVSVKFTQMTISSGALKLEFADTGIGMPLADQNKIFEPFVQLSKMRGTNSSNNGTGLGLPIVRRLIDKMGGSFTVDSIEGKGTTFFIMLPNVELAEINDYTPNNQVYFSEFDMSHNLINNDSEDDNESDGQVKTDPDKRKDKTDSAAESLHILIVDDVSINIKILSAIFKRIGVSYETSTSAKRALEKMKTNQYDWVFTDFNMPEMNGEELAKIIRNTPEYKKVKIAIVSAEIDQIPYDKSLFDACLFKPFDRHKISKTLFGGEK